MNLEVVTCLSEIEQLDREVIALLQKRFKLARELGVAKKSSGLPVFDRERERLLVDQVRAMTSESSERDNLVAVFGHILEESRAVELKAAAAWDRVKKLQNAGPNA
jgi:chorismate mutase/prephenate dehydratase